MGNKIYKSALGFILGALLLSILWPYEQQLIDFDLEPDFNVLESDEIYFNNTRLVYYRTTESEDLNTAGFKVHRMSKFQQDSTNEFVNFAIINHWREDRAYIVLEASSPSDFRDTIFIAVGDTLIKILLERMDYRDHYGFASEILKRSLNYEIPYRVTNTDSTILFGTTQNANINEVILKDYFRLVGRFR
jgi:hypothetical protein